MKIIKNKIFQIITVLILLVGIGFILISNSKQVMASDELTKEEYLIKVSEIEARLTALETENAQLKIDLENANKKITELETNKDLSKLTIRVDKIEDREDKLYQAIRYPSGSNISNYMKVYKQTGKEPYPLSVTPRTETNN